MNALQFWHEHIGQHVSDEPAGYLKARVPTRLKRGVDLNALGAGIDAFYIACENDSYLIGKIELPSSKTLTFVPSEETSGERFIARWLAHDAPTDKLWVVGVIGKADPASSINYSQAPSLCLFCHQGKSFEFNLFHMREDIELTKDVDWKALSQAIYAYDDFRSLDSFRQEKGTKALERLFKREPNLKEILPKLRAQPHSGEHTLLSWYNRAR